MVRRTRGFIDAKLRVKAQALSTLIDGVPAQCLHRLRIGEGAGAKARRLVLRRSLQTAGRHLEQLGPRHHEVLCLLLAVSRSTPRKMRTKGASGSVTKFSAKPPPKVVMRTSGTIAGAASSHDSSCDIDSESSKRRTAASFSSGGSSRVSKYVFLRNSRCSPPSFSRTFSGRSGPSSAVT
jgi:hypothetical protein